MSGLLQIRSQATERPVADGIRYVLFSRAIFEIFQFGVDAVSVFMSDLLRGRDRTKKGSGDQLVDFDLAALSSASDVDIKVPVLSRVRAVHPERLRLKLSAFLGDDPREASYPSERGDLVAREIGDFSPNLIAVIWNRIYAMGSHLDLRERLAWLEPVAALPTLGGFAFCTTVPEHYQGDNAMDGLLLGRLLFIGLVVAVMLALCHGCGHA